jgi:hypothetical protein
MSPSDLGLAIAGHEVAGDRRGLFRKLAEIASELVSSSDLLRI